MPGEAYPQIPLKVAELVKPQGHMTAGLANDQLGYLIRPTGLTPSRFGAASSTSAATRSHRSTTTSSTSPRRWASVTCSLLRGAGEVFGRGGSARGAHEPCATFPNDDLQPAGADVGGD